MELKQVFHTHTIILAFSAHLSFVCVWIDFPFCFIDFFYRGNMQAPRNDIKQCIKIYDENYHIYICHSPNKLSLVFIA